MNDPILILLISAAVFVALIVFLALKPDHRTKLLEAAFFFAAVGGLIFYGLGHSLDGEGTLLAVLLTVLDTGRMFAGNSDQSVFLPVLREGQIWPLILFWIIHFFAYFTTASAALTVLGSGLLQRMRRALLWLHDVELIYGISEGTLSLGRELGEGKGSLVFVGEANSSQELAIRQMGGVIYSDSEAMNPKVSFLKRRLSVRPGKRKFRLYALSKAEDENLAYAFAMIKCLQTAGIHPEQTSLVLLGREEFYGGDLQNDENHYGFGTVKVWEITELAARLLIRKHPVCDAISFEENGTATQDVDALLIGFGKTGQEVLRKLVANGQFEGSRFHAAVFDPEIRQIDGFYYGRYEAMLKAYDIDFFPYDGRSGELRRYLEEHADSLNYIVVSAGDLAICRELSMETFAFLTGLGKPKDIYQCAKNGVTHYPADGGSCEKWGLYDFETLCGESMDRMAKRLNHYYCEKIGTEEGNWAKTSYFSRMSSRASSDYLSALLRRTDSLGTVEPSSAKLDNLSRSEHLRWMAFHYSMGYSPMPRAVLEERAARYPEIGQFTKDAEHRQHALMIPWEDLPVMDAYEESVAGKPVNYQQKDTDNILALRELMD